MDTPAPHEPSGFPTSDADDTQAAGLPSGAVLVVNLPAGSTVTAVFDDGRQPVDLTERAAKLAAAALAAAPSAVAAAAGEVGGDETVDVGHIDVTLPENSDVRQVAATLVDPAVGDTTTYTLDELQQLWVDGVRLLLADALQ